METQNLVLQWICLGLLAVLLIGNLTWFVAPVIECPVLPELEVPEVNLTGVEGRLTEIEATLDEDGDWEDEAEALAIEELERKDYRELGNFLKDTYIEFEDKDDIDKVFIKDITVETADVDDKDATITLELKVYWEAPNIDINYKDYITATVTIEDGEVEDIDFDFTE